MGAAVGLILGGALTEHDWRWTFFINVPIGLLVAFLAPRVLVGSDRSEGSFDLVGAVTGTAGLVGIVYGLTHAAEPTGGWGSPLTLTSLIAGVVLLVAFVSVERRNPHALLPIRILADRTRGVSLFVMLVVGACMFAMFYFLGLYLQQVLGYGPLKAGLAFLPFSGAMVLGAGLASSLASRVDARWISGPGAILATIGMWGFTHLTIDNSYATDLLPWIVVLAVGMGLTFVPLTLTAVAGVDDEDSGAASAALNTAQQIGGAIGLAALTTVFSHAFRGKSAELVATLAAQASSMTPDQVRHSTGLIPLVRPTPPPVASWSEPGCSRCRRSSSCSPCGSSTKSSPPVRNTRASTSADSFSRHGRRWRPPLRRWPPPSSHTVAPGHRSRPSVTS